MTVRMYAGRKKWPLEDVRITLRHFREYDNDCENCGDTPAKIDVLDRQIEFVGDLTDEMRARLIEIADKCPVHRTLCGELEVRTSAA